MQGTGPATTMSYEKFKMAMRASMLDNGVVDQLKTQVRASLAKELHAKHLMLKGPRPAAAQSLRHKAVESLVDDFLATSGMQYTRSVFYPESHGGLSGGKASQAPARSDILQALGLDQCRHQLSTRNLTVEDASMSQSSPSLLLQLLDLLEQSVNKRVATCEVQTEDLSSVPGDFESRLRGVDDDFERQAQAARDNPILSVQERMIAYQRECDARARDEVAAELVRLKKTEVQRMRAEEKALNIKAVAARRAELEAEYAERTERQRRREADAMERLKEREKTMDADAHAHRQKMLADLERLREREEQIARERALEERQRLMNLRSLEERETRLEEKIAAADKYRANMEAEVADQVAKVSAGAASETNALLQQIEELKTQLEAEKCRSSEAEGQLAAARSANSDEASAGTRMEVMVDHENGRERLTLEAGTSPHLPPDSLNTTLAVSGGTTGSHQSQLVGRQPCDGSAETDEPSVDEQSAPIGPLAGTNVGENVPRTTSHDLKRLQIQINDLQKATNEAKRCQYRAEEQLQDELEAVEHITQELENSQLACRAAGRQVGNLNSLLGRANETIASLEEERDLQARDVASLEEQLRQLRDEARSRPVATSAPAVSGSSSTDQMLSALLAQMAAQAVSPSQPPQPMYAWPAPVAPHYAQYQSLPAQPPLQSVHPNASALGQQEDILRRQREEFEQEREKMRQEFEQQHLAARARAAQEQEAAARMMESKIMEEQSAAQAARLAQVETAMKEAEDARRQVEAELSELQAAERKAAELKRKELAEAAEREASIRRAAEEQAVQADKQGDKSRIIDAVAQQSGNVSKPVELATGTAVGTVDTSVARINSEHTEDAPSVLTVPQGQQYDLTSLTSPPLLARGTRVGTPANLASKSHDDLLPSLRSPDPSHGGFARVDLPEETASKGETAVAVQKMTNLRMGIQAIPQEQEQEPEPDRGSTPKPEPEPEPEPEPHFEMAPESEPNPEFAPTALPAPTSTPELAPITTTHSEPTVADRDAGEIEVQSFTVSSEQISSFTSGDGGTALGLSSPLATAPEPALISQQDRLMAALESKAGAWGSSADVNAPEQSPLATEIVEEVPSEIASEASAYSNDFDDDDESDYVVHRFTSVGQDSEDEIYSMSDD